MSSFASLRLCARQNQPKNSYQYLKGTWQLEKVTANQILVTHTVKVEPLSNTEKFFFYGIYLLNLKEDKVVIIVSRLFLYLFF